MSEKLKDGKKDNVVVRLFFELCGWKSSSCGGLSFLRVL